MLRYNIRTGVKSIKTKTAIVASAAVLGISSLGMAVVVPAASHAAGDGTDHIGSFTVVTPDGSSCGGTWATDTVTRDYAVHNNGDGTFTVHEMDKNGSFTTTGPNSPGACETTSNHGSTVLPGVVGNFQGFYTFTVASTTYNPSGCSSINCGVRAVFLANVFPGGDYASTGVCDFNFEYNSNDKSLKYHHWQDKADTTCSDKFEGDIANS